MQFLPLDGFEFNEFKGKPMVLTPNSSSSLTEVTSKKYVHLLLGCTLPLPNGDKFTIESVDYIFNGEYFTPSGKKTDILKKQKILTTWHILVKTLGILAKYKRFDFTHFIIKVDKKTIRKN